MRLRFHAALAAVGLAVGVTLGGHDAGTVRPAAAQGLEVVTPTDVRPEQRIDVNGSLIDITYVEDARQAGAVFFQDERQRFQRAGTDPAGRPYGLFLTSDMTGQPALIVLDLSWLAEEDEQGYVNLHVSESGTGGQRRNAGTHASIRIRLQPQADGTYLAREYWELAKGSKVNNTDWGVQEAYTTRDDSINARTDNGPDDDEARAQYERRLREQDEDD